MLTSSSERIHEHVRMRRQSYGTYSWFPRDTRRDDNDFSSRQSLLETIVGGKVARNLCRRGDVREIGRHTGSVHDIIEAQLHIACVSYTRAMDASIKTHLCDQGVVLEEKR